MTPAKLAEIKSRYDVDRPTFAGPAINELIAEIESLAADRDRKHEALVAVADKLDYLVNLWGAEGVTRSVQDKVKKALEPAEGE